MKLGNQYASLLESDRFPKTVLAAICLSLALRLCEENLRAAIDLVWDEWQTLYANGVVPQPAPKR